MKISSVLGRSIAASCLALLACEKDGPATTSPEPAAPAEEADQVQVAAQGPAPGEGETTDDKVAKAEDAGSDQEKKKEPARPPFDPSNITIGTFELNYAFDDIDDRSELANSQNAATAEDWVWKRDILAKAIKEADLDILAVQSIGGEREAIELASAIGEIGGPAYELAYIESEDSFTGQQIALLSRYAVLETKRFELSVSKQMVSEVAFPNDQHLNVVVVHLRPGKYKAQQKARATEAKAIKRMVDKLEGPTVILGGTFAVYLPDDEGYKESAAGLLAGANTRRTEDDCADSGYSARKTHRSGMALDRIFACGVSMESANTYGRDILFRGDADPRKGSWSDVPIDKPPLRDGSDHLIVGATIALPAKAGTAKADDDGDDE